MMTNELYLAVLPLMHMGGIAVGTTEQVLTLFPNKDLATEFFEDEVDEYLNFFQTHAKHYLTGGHVKGYRVAKEPSAQGGQRWIVKVMQDVS